MSGLPEALDNAVKSGGSSLAAMFSIPKLDEMPPIEVVPNDCVVIGAGLLGVTATGVYWPATPGKEAFRVTTILDPSLVPHVVAALMGALRVPVSTSTTNRKFVLNQFFYGQTGKTLFADAGNASEQIRRFLTICAMWPMSYANRFGIDTLRESKADGVEWLEAVLVGTQRRISDKGASIDAAIPFFPMFGAQSQMLYVRGVTSVCDPAKIIDVVGGTASLPMDGNGKIDLDAVYQYGVAALLSNVMYEGGELTGLPDRVRTNEESNALTSTPGAVLSALDDMLRVWERKILQREKGISKVSGTVKLLSVPMITVQRTLLRKFAIIQGPTRNLYNAHIDNLDGAVSKLVERWGLQQSSYRSRNQTHVRAASKSVATDWLSAAEKGAVPMYRAEMGSDILASLGRDNDPNAPSKMRAVRVLIPADLHWFIPNRLSSVTKNIERSKKSNDPVEKDQYTNWMYFFALLSTYIYAHYFIPTGLGTTAQESDDAPSKYMTRVARLIGAYIEDTKNNPNYTQIKPWWIEDSERALLLRVMRSMDVTESQKWS